ncbi:MAG: NUDIX domain-containing protein [Chloroflexota bacterium]
MNTPPGASLPLMELEIFRHPDAPRQGHAIRREAVRGVIRDGRRLLMIYSSVNTDYKFPGGGRKDGETLPQTLQREVEEECGATITHVDAFLGKVTEYDLPYENGYQLFQMTSYYYLCRISDEQKPPDLDEYERRLGFQPIWVDIEDALRANRFVLTNRFSNIPKWTARETRVLEYLRQHLITG